MIRSHRPAPPLDRSVATFLYFKGLAPGHGFERFLPDGNVEIIVDLAGRPEHIYDGATLRPIQTCHGAWASGVRTGHLTLSSGHRSELFVILFRKGMAYPFFPAPMHEMAERVGVAPKTYARLARFQKAVRDIEASGRAEWSSVARDCGFYDQAHFIHDFKRFSGFTPSEYVRRKSRDFNYVPVG